MVHAIRHWGAGYGVYWQVIDNVSSGSNHIEFGVFHPNGGLSEAGNVLNALFTTAAPAFRPVTE